MTAPVVSEECKEQHAVKIQESNIALDYILTSIDATCKALVWRVRCPAETGRLLNSTF